MGVLRAEKSRDVGLGLPVWLPLAQGGRGKKSVALGMSSLMSLLDWVSRLVVVEYGLAEEVGDGRGKKVGATMVLVLPLGRV